MVAVQDISQDPQSVESSDFNFGDFFEEHFVFGLMFAMCGGNNEN